MSGNRLTRSGAGMALIIGGLVGGLVGGVVGGAAVATALSRPAVATATPYYACLKGGLLSKVSKSNETCGNGYSLIAWNQTGPRGAQGVAGKPAALPSGGYYLVAYNSLGGIIGATCSGQSGVALTLVAQGSNSSEAGIYGVTVLPPYQSIAACPFNK